MAKIIGNTTATPYRQVQADFLQNDNSKRDYVKNKPTFDINTSINRVILRSEKVIPIGNSINVVVLPFMGAIAGESYSLEINGILNDGNIVEENFTVTTKLDAQGFVTFYGFGKELGKDGMNIDNSFNFIPNEDYCIIFHSNPNLKSVEITIQSGRLLKQVQRKYLPITSTIDESDNLPTAKAVYDELQNIVFKEDGKGLSTNDFTDDYKTKVDNAASTEYVDGLVGDIETVLDNIITVQNSYIGGAE